MNMLKKVVAGATLAVVSLALAQVARIELQADMTGIGKGRVYWRLETKGTQSQAELQAEGEGLPRNAALALTIGSNPAFAVFTDGFGAYRLSRRYTTAARPTINAGDSVSLSDGSGTIIQSGVMQPK